MRLTIRVSCPLCISGKHLKREDLLVSPELQDIINSTFSNECDYQPGGQQSDEEPTTDSVAKTKFIQMSSAQPDSSDSSTNDCYYSNNGNAVIFRETTV